MLEEGCKEDAERREEKKEMKEKKKEEKEKKKKKKKEKEKEKKQKEKKKRSSGDMKVESVCEMQTRLVGREGERLVYQKCGECRQEGGLPLSTCPGMRAPQMQYSISVAVTPAVSEETPPGRGDDDA